MVRKNFRSNNQDESVLEDNNTHYVSKQIELYFESTSRDAFSCDDDKDNEYGNNNKTDKNTQYIYEGYAKIENYGDKYKDNNDQNSIFKNNRKEKKYKNIIRHFQERIKSEHD